MHGPATVGWLLVALCAATGACCALRARGSTGTRREEAVSEALMCLGMTVMALPDSPFWSPYSPVPLALYVTVFGAVTAWEVRLLLAHRGGEGAHAAHLHHAVGALAMLYMAAAMAASPGHAHGGAHAGGTATGAAGAAGLPLLTGALLAYFAFYVLRSGARLMPAGDGAREESGGALLRQPGVVAGVRLAMGTGMFAMLLTL
ncbi:DUF5134 domain-containing protein [Streptomyces sp. NPDC048172]|uniref:DUF5134 domain-containing protein n=1 Tax=Streptomyces sp. NPDC048172 TaxID=3365505 RepID=UPI003723ABC5